MIFNRTQIDVRKALQLRKEKVQQKQALTEADKSALERGTLSLSTLNRIEYKQAELMGIIRDMGYYITIHNREWTRNDIFTKSDFERITRNNTQLREAFFVYEDTPSDAEPRYYFQEINSLERILYDLEDMAEYVKQHYRECGNYTCGEG